MDRLEKFKIAFTSKHSSIHDEIILNELYMNFDDKYIDGLISAFDYKKYEIKNIIKKAVIDNIIKVRFLSAVSDSYNSDESYLVNRYYNDIEKLSDSMYGDIKTLILGE